MIAIFHDMIEKTMEVFMDDFSVFGNSFHSQFGRSGMDMLNVPLESMVLTFLCGIHSRSALGITSSSGGNSSQNPTTSPTSLPLTLSRTSIETEWFHVLRLLSIEESKAEDEANVEDTTYPGKEDGLDSLSFMAWAKAALMTFSE
nr:cytochrome c maturase subunit B, mitochondrial [Tanacetum cinerariifolium]